MAAAGTRARSGALAPEESERLGECLARLNRTLRREVALPLGSSAIQALGTLHDTGRLGLGDLARHEGVTPATLSRVVALLEEEGYAVRTTDERDRRAAFLEITDAGREVVARIRRDRARVLDARAGGLTPQQASAVRAALDALEALADA